MKCKDCGKTLPENTEVCPSCGHAVNQNYIALLNRIAVHDPQAFDDLCRLTGSAAYFTILQTVQKPEDAGNVLRAVYSRVFTALDTLPNANAFEDWFSCTIGNTCKEFLQKNQPELFAENEQTGNADILQEENSEFPLDQHFNTVQACQAFMEIIGNLPVEQRLCVLLHDYRGVPVSYLAQELGLSQNAIYAWLGSARKKIEEDIPAFMEKQNIPLQNIPITPLLRFMLNKQARRTIMPFSLRQQFSEKISPESSSMQTKSKIALPAVPVITKQIPKQSTEANSKQKPPYKVLISLLCVIVAIGVAIAALLIHGAATNSKSVATASKARNAALTSSAGSSDRSSAAAIPAAAAQSSSASSSVPEKQYTATDLIGMTKGDIISKAFHNQYQTTDVDVGAGMEHGIYNEALYPYYVIDACEPSDPDNEKPRAILVKSGGKISDNITIGMHYNDFLNTVDSIDGVYGAQSQSADPTNPYHWLSDVMIHGDSLTIAFQFDDAVAQQKENRIQQELNINDRPIDSGDFINCYVPFDVSDVNPVSVEAVLWENEPLGSKTCTIQANGGANLRTCPSQSSPKLITIANGSQVNILNNTTYGSWDEVYWNGKVGFVLNQYIS